MKKKLKKTKWGKEGQYSYEKYSSYYFFDKNDLQQGQDMLIDSKNFISISNYKNDLLIGLAININIDLKS